ncbi:hypothetical protein FJY63_03190 [Candidatus Sumerlaeota bacterium]|nr:hypothetical protein [Candidatus Sumerlaeota bacterium]
MARSRTSRKPTNGRSATVVPTDQQPSVGILSNLPPPASHFCFILLLAAIPTVCSSGEIPKWFPNEIAYHGFKAALQAADETYDAKERMTRRPFSSPGYHTTLSGGMVHSTRESLAYAVALLDSGEPERLRTAQAILRRIIALQDQNPDHKTYGIWSWFLEEPLEKMSPPDWNWADFCGVQLLQVAHDHAARLTEDLREQVRRSILHAAASIKRRNVGPGYTNIAVMGTYVTLVAGELFGDRESFEYGENRLKRFRDYTLEQGSFAEYNSPTYTIVAIKEISRMLNHVRDEESRRMVGEINRIAWRHVARHFHPPTRQWAGPHSRCYRTILDRSTLAFIQRGAGNKARFMSDAEAAEGLDAWRIAAKCPDDLVSYFTSPPLPRQERETFVKREKSQADIVGTTWLDHSFTIGSVNSSNLWNQRRSLIAYWKQGEGVGALRLRCLHNGYDFSSASFFSVQDKSDILGAVVFATDGGDTHPSLDRVRDATIEAEDLRVRFQLEGEVGNVALPSRLIIGEPVRLVLGDTVCDIKIADATFGNLPVSTEIGRDSESAWLDLVLYHGKPRKISFRDIQRATVIFALAMTPKSQQGESKNRFLRLSLSLDGKQQTTSATWVRGEGAKMLLTVPLKPAPSNSLERAASARLGEINPWK